MELLFEIDKKDYDPNGEVFSRPSARAIFITGAMLKIVKNYLSIRMPKCERSLFRCL